MLLKELEFREYYHQYVVIEGGDFAADLTGVEPVLKGERFMLCSSFIDGKGLLQFNVLSMGDVWDHCYSGLFRRTMLGIFDPSVLRNQRAKCIRPNARMEVKNQYFLERAERNASVPLKRTREEKRLDNLRDDFYPDIVLAGVLEADGICEYPMYLHSFDGPFAVGELLESSSCGTYIKGEVLYTMPYALAGGIRLLTVFHGSLSEAQKQDERSLAAKAEEIGYGFSNGEWEAA